MHSNRAPSHPGLECLECIRTAHCHTPGSSAYNIFEQSTATPRTRTLMNVFEQRNATPGLEHRTRSNSAPPHLGSNAHECVRTAHFLVGLGRMDTGAPSDVELFGISSWVELAWRVRTESGRGPLLRKTAKF